MSTRLSQVKASEISPTTLRLPPPLRLALQREALIRGSSLSQEIVRRLVESLAHAAGPGLVTGEAASHGRPASTLDDSQRLLLRLFSELPTDKQLALLTLLQR